MVGFRQTRPRLWETPILHAGCPKWVRMSNLGLSQTRPRTRRKLLIGLWLCADSSRGRGWEWERRKKEEPTVRVHWPLILSALLSRVLIYNLLSVLRENLEVAPHPGNPGETAVAVAGIDVEPDVVVFLQKKDWAHTLISRKNVFCSHFELSKHCYYCPGLLRQVQVSYQKNLLYFDINTQPVENYLEFRLYGVFLDSFEDFLRRLDHVGVGGLLLLANVDHNHLSGRK